MTTIELRALCVDALKHEGEVQIKVPQEWKMQQRMKLLPLKGAPFGEPMVGGPDGTMVVFQAQDVLDWLDHTEKGAINWSSCRCLDARQWTDVSTRTGYQVIIDEVDPDATELQVFVQGWLEARGFHSIEVVTAW